jgi:hypothetical protein
MTIQVHTHRYEFEAADRALGELAAGTKGGSIVVTGGFA